MRQHIYRPVHSPHTRYATAAHYVSGSVRRRLPPDHIAHTTRDTLPHAPHLCPHPRLRFTTPTAPPHTLPFPLPHARAHCTHRIFHFACHTYHTPPHPPHYPTYAYTTHTHTLTPHPRAYTPPPPPTARTPRLPPRTALCITTTFVTFVGFVCHCSCRSGYQFPDRFWMDILVQSICLPYTRAVLLPVVSNNCLPPPLYHRRHFMQRFAYHARLLPHCCCYLRHAARAPSGQRIQTFCYAAFTPPLVPAPTCPGARTPSTRPHPYGYPIRLRFHGCAEPPFATFSFSPHTHAHTTFAYICCNVTAHTATLFSSDARRPHPPCPPPHPTLPAAPGSTFCRLITSPPVCGPCGWFDAVGPVQTCSYFAPT